jgi:hypothetical protein
MKKFRITKLILIALICSLPIYLGVYAIIKATTNSYSYGLNEAIDSVLGNNGNIL